VSRYLGFDDFDKSGEKGVPVLDPPKKSEKMGYTKIQGPTPK
jgi:hypothetical protein